jgi:hypothetical protein
MPESQRRATDEQVISYVAHLVEAGRAALKFMRADSGDLPWPQILKDLEHFEGNIPHMYRDTKGFVTVGVGKMLPDVGEAQKLAFVVRATKRPATREQIAADFAKVKAQPWSKDTDADDYDSDLDLPQLEIDRILKVIAQRSAEEVAARYKGFNQYPVQVKQALIDMRYNMNANMDKFLQLNRYTELAYQTGAGRDWELAAQHSHRKDVGGERNDWTRDMILKGGGVKK